MSEWEDFTRSPAVQSAKHAFARAGVTPDDIDVCEIYDAFTHMVLASIEALGFCKAGEGGPFVADGRLRLGGALPDEHRRGRPVALPPRHARDVSCSSRRRANCAARPTADRSRMRKLACVNGTGGWFSSASTVILGA